MRPAICNCPPNLTGLPKDLVANTSQIIAVDRGLFTERVGRLPRASVQLILSGIDVVLGR
jgi:mRNA-degrading endonuclease toxin of MazEF toxin-antitoxin module